MTMLFDVREDARFYCYSKGVDMRKGIQSLYALIKIGSNLDALGGDVFVFIGSNCKSIKVMQWNRNGFLLTYKRLEVGRLSLLLSHDNDLFIELKSPELRKMINRVRHRAVMNELRYRAVSNI